MTKGLEQPIQDLRAYLLPQIPGMSTDTLQAVLFEMISDGPEDVVEPIEAEFKRRGIDPFTYQSAAEQTAAERVHEECNSPTQPSP